MESQGGAEDPLDRAGRIDEEPCVDAGMQQDDSLVDKLEGVPMSCRRWWPLPMLPMLS